jgi:hypothetical protein
MKTPALALVPAVTAALWAAGCDLDGSAIRAQVGAGGGVADSSNTAGVGGGADRRQCGGRLGLPCPEGEYCQFEQGSCGGAEQLGACELRPRTCADDCPGACGCDGQLHCNACMVNAAGLGVVPETGACTHSVFCDEVIHRIANRVARAGTCTSVVRLDFQTRQIKSTVTACGEALAVMPERARAQAEKETGFGAEAQQIAGLAPADEYVFWEPPADHGGVSVVSARSGAVLFGGSIVMNEPGRVVHPVSFLHPASLGKDCGSRGPVPPARGLNLETIEELPPADVQAALAAVWATALPDALALGGALLDAMVLLYPPQVAPFEPSVAEWVVLLNAGAQ